MIPKKIKYLVIFISLVIYNSSKGQSVGDIIFTGYNARGTDDFAFIATTDIPGSVEIRFTDNGWKTIGGFRLGEGELVYTTPTNGLKQGDHIVIVAGTGVILSGEGSAVVNTAMNFTTTGDGVIAFTGSLASPTPIAALNMNTGWSDATSTSTTDVPSGLTDGTTAFNLLVSGSERDGGVYNCSVATGSIAAIQSAVNNSANWTTSNSLHLDLPCTTSWDGSVWSDGTPSVASKVVIGSSNAIGADLNCKDITINSGVTLTLNSNNATIRGDIINNGNGISSSGSIFIDKSGTSTLSGNGVSHEGVLDISERTVFASNGLMTLSASSSTSYGQLSGKGSITGQISMEVYVDPSTPRYFHIGSPFTDALLSEFNEGNLLVSSASAQGSLWEWNSSTSEWDAPGDPNSTTAANGKGYAVYIGSTAHGTFVRSNAGTISMTGSMSTNNVNVPLSYHDGQGVSSSFVGGTGVSATQGWNLVANPFGAAYDWDSQTIPTDLGTAIYRFDGSSYSSYVKGVGGGSRYIAPFQAFFVQLNANTPGNLTFAEVNRDASQNPALSKKSNYVIDGLDVLLRTADSTAMDQLFIGYDPNASLAFDPEYDARKLMNGGSVPNLYTVFNKEFYSINRVNPNDHLQSFPLYLSHPKNEEPLTISADMSRLTSFSLVKLEDLKTGAISDLHIKPYTFNHDTTFRKDRFVIHLSNETVDMENPGSMGKWFAYSSNNMLVINTGELGETEIEVWSASSSLIMKVKSDEKIVQLPVSKRGVYIIRLSAKGYTETQKVIH